MAPIEVTPVPCLRDNYAYLLCAPGSERALVVDPSDARPILDVLEVKGLELCGILNTHHHWDHVGGNEALIARCGQLPVYGHASDEHRIPAINHLLEDGDEFEVEGLRFVILHIPGHTMGAIAYVSGGCVFTGDTLFIAGCGRLFEGTPDDMYRSLNVKLGSLPDETRVYCGHEYTVSNLKFAASIEPSNRAVRRKLAASKEQAARGEPSVPSTLREERLTNPFMRCDSQEIIGNVEAWLPAKVTPAAVLGGIRAAKDAF
jgi:hydroxyacylglutathione hydrolase